MTTACGRKKMDEKEKQLNRQLGEALDVVCDVCGANDRERLGGVVLLDPDDTHTIVCQWCWENFTNVSEAQREKMVPKSELYKNLLALGLDPVSALMKCIQHGENHSMLLQAQISKVGVDSSRKIEQLDPTQSFYNNVLALRAKGAYSMNHLHTPYSHSPPVQWTTKQYRTPSDVVLSYCAGCGQEKSHVMKCSKCRQANYCSKECQKQDWPQHKPKCIAFDELRRKLMGTIQQGQGVEKN